MSPRRIQIITEGLSDHQGRGIGVYAKFLLSYLNRLDLGKKLKIDVGEYQPGYDLYHYLSFNPWRINWPVEERRKMVLTIHDLIEVKFVNKYRPGWRARLIWNWQKLLLRQTAGIITDSRSSKRDITSLIGLKLNQVAAIPLAPTVEVKEYVDLAIAQEIQDRLQLPHKFVLYVGDAGWNKNILTLCQAAIEAKALLVLLCPKLIDPEVDLTHFQNRFIAQFRQLYLKHPYIQVLERVNQQELSLLYWQAYVYVQPSYYEGFGLPALEAMCCQTPAILSRAGSLPEVGGKAAWYFDPEDKDELAALLIRAYNLTVQERGAWGIKCARRCRKYRWSQTAQKTAEFYTKILDSD